MTRHLASNREAKNYLKHLKVEQTHFGINRGSHKSQGLHTSADFLERVSLNLE